MEDSFRVRVDKVFGSLSEPLSTSLWSLTDEEIEKKEWARDSQTGQFDDDVVGPIFTKAQFQRGLIDSPDSHKLIESEDLGQKSDLQNLDDDDDDDMDMDSSERNIGKSSITEEDDDLELRASIGKDCTLDFEEEEDEYDKVAIGKENSGERLYWKDVNDYGVVVNTFHELPGGFNDVAKDPRANHLAAKLRLKEDSEATGGSHELGLCETSRAIASSLSNAEVPTASPLDNIGSHGDGDGGSENPKPILKNNKIVKKSVCKSHKRVRFEPQFDASTDNTRGQNQEASKALTITGDNLVSSSSITMDRSRYTHYTLDSSDDMDEQSNRKAYTDFLNLIKKPEATEMQLDVDFSKPPTFTPRKASMVYRESKSTQNPGDISNDRTFPICIADESVQDNKMSAIEEDDSPVVDKGVHKSGRQYRTRSKTVVE